MSPGAATVRAISRLPAPQVWRVRIDHSCAYFEKHLRTLDTIERERAARFRHVEDRRRFVLGRSSLRRLLAAELGVADSALVFGVNVNEYCVHPVVPETPVVCPSTVPVL